MARLITETRRDFEVRRYPILVYAMAPLGALVLQAWLPRLVGERYTWFDLPLVLTVYFALARHSPIQGTLIGGAIGNFEDALTHHPIGLNGIAKTIIGFMAAWVGLRIETENTAIRLLLTFGLSLAGSGIYIVVYRYVLGLAVQDWSWINELFKGAGNSLLALVLFPLMDRLQVRD